MALNVILLVTGLVICFGGIYFKKLSAALLGLFWGVVVSAITIAIIIISKHGLWALGSALDDGEYIALVLIIGVVIAAISAAMDRLCAAINAFLGGLFIVFVLLGALVEDLDSASIVIIVSVAIAALIAYFAYIYYNYSFVIVTAFSGALLATLSGMAIASEENFVEFLLDVVLYGNENAYLTLYGITFALGIIGFFVQRNRLLQLQNGSADTVKPVDLTRAKDTAEKAVEQTKNVSKKVGETIAPAANTIGISIKNAWEDIKTESKARSLGEELKQEWILLVPVIVSTIICRLIWNILYDSYNYSTALYTVTNWLFYISAGMAAAVMVYFILTKDIKLNLLYLTPWIAAFLIFNSSNYAFYDTASLFYSMFRVVIIWLILYIIAKIVKQDSIKPVLLSALYFVLDYYLLDRIVYKSTYFYFQPIYWVFLIALFGSLYWLMKNKGVNIFSFKGAAAVKMTASATVNEQSATPTATPDRTVITNPEPAATEALYCPDCGAPVRMPQHFCIKCGRKLDV